MLQLRSRTPLAEPPPRDSFGSPLQLGKVHWVTPELVEVTYLAWTEENLLRQVSYPAATPPPNRYVGKKIIQPTAAMHDKSSAVIK